MSVIGGSWACRTLRRNRAGDILYVFASLVISPSVLVYLSRSVAALLSCICHEQLLRDRLLSVEPRERPPATAARSHRPHSIIITFYFQYRVSARSAAPPPPPPHGGMRRHLDSLLLLYLQQIACPRILNRTL